MRLSSKLLSDFEFGQPLSILWVTDLGITGLGSVSTFSGLETHCTFSQQHTLSPIPAVLPGPDPTPVTLACCLNLGKSLLPPELTAVFWGQ